MTTGPSIKRKIMAAIFMTSITVLALTILAFVTYDLFTFRENMVRNLLTVARIVADNSSAALAFNNEKDATEVLSSLRAEPQVALAALFDADQKLFVAYPPGSSTNRFPLMPRERAYYFGGSELVVYEPVTQGTAHLGTLYLKADLSLFYQRLQIYAGLCLLILLGSGVVALTLSNRLQKRVTDPILALARVARDVSLRRDYSARAPELSDDELGLLTTAFNHMLTRIEEQTLALKESDARLRLALEAFRTGSWDWDLATDQLRFDDYLCALHGLKPAECLGTIEHFLSLVHPEDRSLVESAIKAARDEGKDFTAEYRLIWPDRSIHYISSKGRAFYDATGKAIRITGVSQDVTERQQKEEASRRLAALVRFSDDAIIGKDLKGIITSWNAGAERIFGYSAQHAVGQPITIIIPADRLEEERRILERIRNGESTEHYETVRQRKDGSTLEVSLTVSPIKDSQGRIIGASKIARDITEMKRARTALENQARILREQAQMLDLANVMIRDLDDRIILWNAGMEKIYGWKRSEMLGRISHEALQTTFPKPLSEIRADLVRHGQWEGELGHTRKDGVKMTVASLWVLHRDTNGKPSAILEVNTDITERKRAEEQLSRMNAELERRVQERTAELTTANQELEAFTYSVAHDLRAPLRHIDAFTKIIFDDFAADMAPEARHFLENIRKGSQNMNRLVDDLLNLARVGRQELKREVTPLNSVVAEVIGELRGETGQRNLEWRVGPLPTVEIDPGLIKQVFANLLGNAVKYTRPRDKAIIEIGQQQIDGRPTIYVRDNGVGFDMKYADKLFGVFQRLHRSDEFEGTGVGLATVDRIIRKHGGQIWAQAELNKGATFYFTVGKSSGNPKPAPRETAFR